MSYRVLNLLLSLILVCAVAPVSGAESTAGPGPAAKKPPNIILILTDDEDWKAHDFMSRVRTLLQGPGATFSNYFVNYATCCPSRSSLLRGQYPHNTGVLGNKPPGGGFGRFLALGNESSTVATWLQDRGYYTALAGKYLNGYGDPRLAGGTAHVPPGWTDWFAVADPAHYYNYTVSDNGRAVHFGHAAQDYQTDVLLGHALAVIRKARAAGKPLFLYLAPKAPHLPAEPAPRHAGLFASATMPRGESFDEEDVSDKPAAIRDRPRLSLLQIHRMTSIYRDRLRSLQSVDEMVEAIVRELRDMGELDHTYILYASDNGWHMGEHRLGWGKNTPYEEDIRVPLVIRGPGVPAGAVIDRIAVNQDLAPTIAELAGVTPPDFVDGRSLVPLWRDGNVPWRQCFLVQRGSEAGLQVDEGDDPSTPWGFLALRTGQYLYAQWTNGDRELYDVLADPAELHNLVATADPALVGVLARRTTQLATCKGDGCRHLENAPLR